MGLPTLNLTLTERTQMVNPFMRCLAFIPILITPITTALCTPGHRCFSTSATTPLAVIAVFGVDMVAFGAAAALALGGVEVMVNFRIAGG